MSNPSSHSSEDCVEQSTDSNDSQQSAEGISVKRKRKHDKAIAGSAVSQPLLPPCRICGEKASGFHYGVNTCEACKAFFRRSICRGAQYACSASGKCEILPGKRSSCAACRLKKCIALGMSKSAIKTGRYTYAKKAKDIMEVKGLKEQPVVCPESELAEATTTDYSELQRIGRSSPAERGPLLPELSVYELDEVIQQITAAQARTVLWTPDVLAKQAEREKHYLELKAVRQQIFGPLKTLTEEEYMRIYQTTGIEIDDRRDVLQTRLREFTVKVIKHFVKFVKAIPGFDQLPIEDQTSLLKASRAEYWMITAQHAFNPVEKLYVHHDGCVMSIDDITALNNSRDESEAVFQLQGKLQKLCLNDEENSILTALCIMSADVCHLENADQVVSCQSLLRKCLLRLMDKYHSDDPLFIARVFAILVEMRGFCEKLKLRQVQISLRWADKVHIPPLMSEILSPL